MCESRLMKWFVTSLMTKGTRFHRQGITDVKTNLAPLKGFKGSFVMGWGGGADKVGDLIENPSPLSRVSHVGGIKLMNIWSVFCQLR